MLTKLQRQTWWRLGGSNETNCVRTPPSILLAETAVGLQLFFLRTVFLSQVGIKTCAQPTVDRGSTDGQCTVVAPTSTNIADTRLRLFTDETPSPEIIRPSAISHEVRVRWLGRGRPLSSTACCPSERLDRTCYCHLCGQKVRHTSLTDVSQVPGEARLSPALPRRQSAAAGETVFTCRMFSGLWSLSDKPCSVVATNAGCA